LVALERAIRFFDQRFAERVTMKEAAQVACLSPDHFVEVFRSAVGCTPHQYLLRCRLRHARQVIASDGHRRPLAEIALAAGFSDQSHLTRHFHAPLGRAPASGGNKPRSGDRERLLVSCKRGSTFPVLFKTHG
jgi:transcriptional regulator GlxA family with amidase domain